MLHAHKHRCLPKDLCLPPAHMYLPGQYQNQCRTQPPPLGGWSHLLLPLCPDGTTSTSSMTLHNATAEQQGLAALPSA